MESRKGSTPASDFKSFCDHNHPYCMYNGEVSRAKWPESQGCQCIYGIWWHDHRGFLWCDADGQGDNSAYNDYHRKVFLIASIY